MSMNLDDFGKLALERYNVLVDQYNTMVGKTKKVESKDKFIEVFMQEDERFANFNNEIERLESEVESLKSRRLVAATPLVEPAYQEALANVGVDPEAVKDLRKSLTAAARFLIVTYGETVLDGTTKPEAVRTGGSATGTGGRRIRGFDWYVDGEKATIKNKDGIPKSTATAAAKVLDVPVPELQEAWLKEAGSEDWKNEAFPTLIDFEYAGKNVRVVKSDDSDEE